MPRVQTCLDDHTGFVNAISPHLVWRRSRATPCARYLGPRTLHSPCVAFSPRRKIGVGGGYLLTSQARYSECCATVHRRCQRCSGLGVVGRVSSLPRVICTRHVSIPPRPLAAARLPLVGQALLSAGGVHRRWAYTLGAEAQVTF